jgi:C4-dicarboxylate-binding protein DctP
VTTGDHATVARALDEEVLVYALLGRAARSLSILAPGAVVVALSGCGDRAAVGELQYELRFSHVTSEDTPKGRAAREFERVVEEVSDGRVQVEVFPDSELYGDVDELQAIQSGAVQVLAPASSKFTKIAPELQVLDLPFLFDSVDDVDAVLDPDSEAGRSIFDSENLGSRNIKVLGLWDNGFKQLSASLPITGPESLSGLRFRIQPSDVLRSQFAAWGANVTPLAFGDLRGALEHGLVDGQENTWSNIETQHLDEVQQYIVHSDHGYLGYVLVINEPFFASLPADLQRAVLRGATAATAYNRKIAFDLNDRARRSIVDRGEATVSELTPSQRAALRASVVPSVWWEYAAVLGHALVGHLLARSRN